jgi:hypothetical protein
VEIALFGSVSLRALSLVPAMMVPLIWAWPGGYSTGQRMWQPAWYAFAALVWYAGEARMYSQAAAWGWRPPMLSSPR